MRLGIDLGTSRTVVAFADRGNFPVVAFTDESGDAFEHVPSMIAEANGELVFGLAAREAERAGAPTIASWKRLLFTSAADTPVTVGAVTTTVLDLATGYLVALKRALAEQAAPPAPADAPLEVAVAVPANAHSTQRFITLEAFRRAGFTVVKMLNEPSAAGLEYAHRYKSTLTSKREHVVVYDLGGGTFDAALVRMSEGHHDVLATSGVSRLGGDDFDEALLDLALDVAGADLARAGVPSIRARLLEECRLAKESLNPSSRKITIDLAALEDAAPSKPVVIAATDYYERVRPLVERSIAALSPVLAAASHTDDPEQGGAEVAGIYVVGGASGLPVVPRVLRERFSRRVHRSPYPSAATAIGLAIAACDEDAPAVTERFTRHLGVFREMESGAKVSFDGIIPKGTMMPQNGTPLTITRSYRAHHNLGYYRFVECGELDSAGDPSGDITPHAEVFFPFLPELRGRWDLKRVPVERLNRLGPIIEERYELDASGILAVTITNVGAGYSRRYVL